MSVVSLLLQEVPHYRVSFLDGLRARLANHGVELEVLYGCDSERVRGHGAPFDRTWSVRVPTVATRLGGFDVVWQSCGDLLRRADLVIVEQSNRLLVNYLLQVRRSWSDFRLAYWGHGKNLQSRRPHGLRERIKRSLLRRVDWWFAYTELTRSYVVAQGFPAERITVVNNTIDGYELARELSVCQEYSPAEVAISLGCKAGAKVALYCGQLHAHKRLDFLLEASRRVRHQLPEFELLIIGDGPERPLLEAAARNSEWIHYAGTVLGAERARYWHAAQIAMMPGLVGLVIVDSFIANRPLVTTTYRYHSPEIAYLKPEINGVMTTNDVGSYARDAIALLQDDRRRLELAQECARSAKCYSLQSMIERFATGIERCLGITDVAAVC